MRNEEKAVEISLGKGIDISLVENFLEELEKKKNEGHIKLMASEVEKMDTSAFQILVSLKNYAVNQHAIVEWDKPSDKCLKAAEMLGFKEIFDL